MIHVWQLVTLQADGVRVDAEDRPHRFLGAPEQHDLGSPVLALEPGRAVVFPAQREPLPRIVLILPDAVQNPCDDGLDIDLRALGLEEALEPVIAVAFRGHRPEFADDRDLGFGAQPVHRHSIEPSAASDERRDDTPAPP